MFTYPQLFSPSFLMTPNCLFKGTVHLEHIVWKLFCMSTTYPLPNLPLIFLPAARLQIISGSISIILSVYINYQNIFRCLHSWGHSWVLKRVQKVERRVFLDTEKSRMLMTYPVWDSIKSSLHHWVWPGSLQCLTILPSTDIYVNKNCRGFASIPCSNPTIIGGLL